MKKPYLLAGFGAAILALAAVLIAVSMRDDLATPLGNGAPASSSMDPSAVNGGESSIAGDETRKDAPSDETAGAAGGTLTQTARNALRKTEKANRPSSSPAPPAFDVVRIDPNGNMVIAGRAEPGSEVVIYDGESELGRAPANAQGEWVFLPESPVRPGERELALKSIGRGGEETIADDVVVLVAPKTAREKTLVVKTNRARGVSRILQGTGPLPEGAEIAIDAVDYTEEGRLTISGRAGDKGLVQAYLDNALIGRTEIEGGGVWTIRPTAPAAMGAHTLRADLLDAGGDVKGRAQLTFRRIEIGSMPPGRRVLVRPGNSLWRLARRAYGDGLAYTVIYDANKGQIREPDLIYPGQVFVVPKR